MGEWVDILDEARNPPGTTALKSEAHRKGLFHPTIHVWFYTSDQRLLLQQRGKSKKSFPLLWDVSVAGHVSAGESIIEAAIRETEEEIGLSINADDLEKIGVYKAVHRHGPEYLDCEYHHTFISLLNVPLHKLRKQNSEVEALDLIPLIQFAEEAWGMANTARFVPHEGTYYKDVVRAIKKRLE